MRLLALLALSLFSLTAGADATGDAIRAAMQAPERSETDRARDANRQPVETLAFFGFRKDMRVLELVPGGGWYTRLLAPALKDDGELYVAIGTGRVEEKLLGEPGFEAVKVIPVELETERTEPYRLIRTNKYNFDVSDLDMVLTFRNLHNFLPESRRVMNQAAFDSLKSGGLYGVVDHTARHMEPLSSKNRRRLDPVVAIAEIQSIGFEFVKHSDLHYKANDTLNLEVGDESVTGQTDRFTLLFRKP